MRSTSRRGFLGGLGALFAAPALVRASSLMQITPVPELGHWLGYQPKLAGSYTRLILRGLDHYGQRRIETLLMENTGVVVPTVFQHATTRGSARSLADDKWPRDLPKSVLPKYVSQETYIISPWHRIDSVVMARLDGQDHEFIPLRAEPRIYALCASKPSTLMRQRLLAAALTTRA